MMETNRPDWLPDEYDPDAPLVERLQIMGVLPPDVELHVQGASEVVEVVGGPQNIVDNNAYVRLDCGSSPDSWEWEIVAPKADDAHGPRLDRVDPTRSESVYSATKEVAYLDNVDVRIYGVDESRLQEGNE